MSKYTITAGDVTETKSKRSAADARATELRNELRVDVIVTTDKGNVVFEMAAPKTIKMTPRFQRVVEADKLPEGVEVPAGLRVAYVRPRQGFAVLANDAAEGDRYSLLKLEDSSVLEDTFRTTRDAGKAMTELANA